MSLERIHWKNFSGILECLLDQLQWKESAYNDKL